MEFMQRKDDGGLCRICGLMADGEFQKGNLYGSGD